MPTAVFQFLAEYCHVHGTPTPDILVLSLHIGREVPCDGCRAAASPMGDRGGATYLAPTPIVLAARVGHVRCVRGFANAGISVDAGSPIEAAAAAGHRTVVEALIELGAAVPDAFTDSARGSALVAAAVRRGDPSAIEYLHYVLGAPLQPPPPPSLPPPAPAADTIVATAAAGVPLTPRRPSTVYGAGKLVRAKPKATPAAKPPATAWDLPLHAAARRGDNVGVAMLRALVAMGADPNAADPATGGTAMHAAVAGGHFMTVVTLHDLGASAAVKDAQGRLPRAMLANDDPEYPIALLLKAYGG